jgi:hypothetical protein
VVLALVLVGWTILAGGGSADVYSTAGGARPATVSDEYVVDAGTSASFAQSIRLTSPKGGTNDAKMDLYVQAPVDETYKPVPPTPENGGVKLISWEPKIYVEGSLDSSCRPSPDPQMPSPCDIGYFGPGYQNFTCSAEAVDLSQFPSQLTDPLHADFPLFAGFQTYPSDQAVAVVGGGTLPYMDIFQWEGGPDCKRLDHNEDGGKLLDASLAGGHAVRLLPRRRRGQRDTLGGDGYPPCSNTATGHVANDGLGDSGTRSGDWKMNLQVIVVH